jgi:hypothetical protein
MPAKAGTQRPIERLSLLLDTGFRTLLSGIVIAE